MRTLKQILGRRSEPAGPAASPPENPPPSTVSPETAPPSLERLSVEEIFDHIIARLGFDSAHPGWFDTLRQLHRHSRKRRLQIMPDYFYTSAFSPDSLPAAVWNGTFPDCGRFDLDEQRAFLRETPSRRDELQSQPSSPSVAGDASFFWGNDQFGHADAALYYALIRRFRPQRIVEVGAGYSTTLALRAIAANGVGRVVCVDPHVPESLRSLAGLEIQATPVQEASDSVFLTLAPSDILFIDGSHISKTGSDVNHLLLRILPRLPSGVLVQVHDVGLPYEYPKRLSEEALDYWNEQYVLAALLANSTKYEVVVGTYFLERRDPSALQPFLPVLPGVFPGGESLWIRSRE